MKVTRNGSGWDIAFDMVFTDKATAAIIAQRIAPLLSTLVRDAVDDSMCKHLVAARDMRVNLPAAAPESEGQDLHTEAHLKQQLPVAAPAVYSTHSIAARARAMGLSAS